MKYIILIAVITNILYSYNSKEINNFYNNYYSSKKHDINSLKVCLGATDIAHFLVKKK